MLDGLKIAFVKQDCYQDLYVGNKDMLPQELLFSSQGRVGPIGLFTLYGADYYIVKESKKKECRFWEKTTMSKAAIKNNRQLKNITLDKIPGQEFKRPGSPHPNGHYAVDMEEVDWGQYNIVICINIAFPTELVQRYKNTLWCYMIGAANFGMDRVYYGYDVSFNQEICGRYNRATGVLDFPYTFVGTECLEKIMENYLGRPAEKAGIYGEINTTTQRPVKNIPQFEPISNQTGHAIRVHQQLIKDNLQQMYDAKYYLKVGGRITRGNGAVEAISCGTVVLMSPDDIICRQILPKEAWVFSAEDAIEKIRYLDRNPSEYEKLLQYERNLMNTFVVEYPSYFLEKLYYKKNGKPNRVIQYSNAKYLLDYTKKGINWIQGKSQFSKK